MSDNQRHNKKGQYRTLCSLSHCKLSVMTRTRVLVVILTHTDGRNYILKFLVTLIFEDYTHKRVSALTKLAECQLTLNTHKEHRNQIQTFSSPSSTIFFPPMYIFGVCNIQHKKIQSSYRPFVTCDVAKLGKAFLNSLLYPLFTAFSSELFSLLIIASRVFI